MLPLKSAPLAGLLALALSWQLAEAFPWFFSQDTDFKSEYKKIDKFLMKKLKTKTDPLANINALVPWQIKETSQPMRDALKQLMDMSKVAHDKECLPQSYAIIMRNDRSTDNASSKSMAVTRRVESIVRDITLQHAQVCKSVLPRKYLTIRDSLIEDIPAFPMILDFVDESSLGPLLKMLESPRFRLPVRVAESANQVRWMGSDYRLILNMLKKLGADDPEASATLQPEAGAYLSMNTDGLKEVFTELLVDPCAAIIDSLEPTVFILNTFDCAAQDWSRDCTVTLEEDGELLRDFTRGWLAVEVCKHVVSHQSDFIDKLSQQINNGR